MVSFPKTAKKEATFFLQCTSCHTQVSAQQMITSCNKCHSPLEYVFEGSFDGEPSNRTDMWKNFALIPLLHAENIVSLNEGASEIIRLDELSDNIRGARLSLMLDFQKNPTGTFKDREASIIISRCKELHLNNLVFYSTANTGRAYTHYAAHLGLTTYFFLPRECQYKNTATIKKNENNFFIAVDAHYPEISSYAKKFAARNGLQFIAPLHDRTECYATLAYEQYQQMPVCDFFVQTIASGMGPIGFVRGHKNLIKFGLEQPSQMPRVVCVQSEETNFMYKAYQSGKQKMTDKDMPDTFPDNLFEPTLNSTNPINNYPDLRRCLNDSHGIITDASPKDVLKEGQALIDALARRNIDVASTIEKSLLIGFTGIVKLAAEGKIGKNDQVLLVGTGRGDHSFSRELIPPDITINLLEDDPVDVKQLLDNKAHAGSPTKKEGRENG